MQQHTSEDRGETIRSVPLKEHVGRWLHATDWTVLGARLGHDTRQRNVHIQLTQARKSSRNRRSPHKSSHIAALSLGSRIEDNRPSAHEQERADVSRIETAALQDTLGHPGGWGVGGGTIRL